MTALPLADAMPGGDPEATWAEYRWVIEEAIANDPRTLQTRIGPSELGDPCDRCLVHKLAEVPEVRDAAWLPWIGKAVHASLQEVFEAFNATRGVRRFLTETPVTVGQVGGVPITGSVDLYDVCTAEVTDWKITGVTTMRSAKASGPSQTYRVQQHLYGAGLLAAGFPVVRVRIAYLPRNSPTLAAAFIWDEPFDPQVAATALARANALHAAITAVGVEVVLAQLAPTDGCYGCSRYPLPDGSRPPAPGHRPGNDLRGLIPEATTTAA